MWWHVNIVYTTIAEKYHPAKWIAAAYHLYAVRLGWKTREWKNWSSDASRCWHFCRRSDELLFSALNSANKKIIILIELQFRRKIVFSFHWFCKPKAATFLPLRSPSVWYLNEAKTVFYLIQGKTALEFVHCECYLLWNATLYILPEVLIETRKLLGPVQRGCRCRSITHTAFMSALLSLGGDASLNGYIVLAAPDKIWIARWALRLR